MIKRLFSTVNNQSITITNNAWKKITAINNKQKEFCFLFSATSGGCNGFNYNFNLISEMEYDDIIETNCGKIKPTIIKKDDTQILVDPVSEFLLLGTTIDFVKEDYSKNIFESKFVFKPNKELTASCGCGVSFTPKDF